MRPYPQNGEGWNFYIARPGASPRECIDWVAEGINIQTCGLDGKWGKCQLLIVLPHTRVRISYTFRRKRRVHEIIFPSHDSSVPTHYLEGM